ncbi:cytochrome P450 [Croceivirga lutea]|uniref:cytochrome P450 n=1 Tax=Croceivirga lutea TaxID=1775167 RepID=UPI0016395A14|nr:cytochrome P450 [Croceivirga lutea]GGG54427.1 cytochrome P450 [Croceivirga lutea]
MGNEKSFPVVSFFQFVKRGLEILKNPLPFHHDNFEKKGDTFLLSIGIQNKILFSRNPELLNYVLRTNQKNYTKSEVQTVQVAKYIGKGLLTSEGEFWRTQRRLLQPTFHKKHIANLLQIMQEVIEEEVSKITINKTFSIEPFFGKLAFKVVAKSLFSGEIDETAVEQLQHLIETSQKMLVSELRQPYLKWWYFITGKSSKNEKLVEDARALLANLIQQRRASKIKKDDLLDLLLNAKYEDGSGMAEKQMIDEIMILLVAGHETTANALTFTCQLLAKNPKYQNSIKDENEALEHLDLMSILQKQKVTKNVLEESMRLYPPAYFIDRKNIKKDEFDEFYIASKTPLLFSIIEIHRHKEYWDKAEHFLPERFADSANKYSDIYFPFGAGPRMCIGNNFAMYEMQLIVKELFKKYVIKPLDTAIEIEPLITLKPKNAFLVFEKR